MMRDDLESELADHFDAEHLAIYGDYLQQLGDPRGELIALDLSGVNERDALSRKQQLLIAWLGKPVVEMLGATAIEYGFIEDLYLDGDDRRSGLLLDAILAGPAAAYLRGVTILGDPMWVQTAVRMLAMRSHRFLERLSMQTVGYFFSPVVDPELAASLARATPRLEQLEVWGQCVFDVIAHPALRSLRVTGHDAVGEVIGGGAELPSVVVLDLAFCVEDDVLPSFGLSRHVGGGLPAVQLPKLRRLDLSRNEPGFRSPHYLGGSHDPFAFLAQLPVRSQLTHVRLPSVRSRDQADALHSAVGSMPLLRELAIVRTYHHLPDLYLPEIARLPEPWRWPPADRAIAHIVMIVAPASRWLARERSFDLPLPAMVAWLEQHFDELSPVGRDGWRELFERIELASRHAQFSPRVLQAMLQRLEPGEGVDDWIRLREVVRADADVVVLFGWQ
jgi:hypothetical protein